MTASPGARARAAARKAAQPVLGRIQAEAASSLRPELDAALVELERLRGELERSRSELGAEIELLWAELDGRRPPTIDP